jgi:molybdopterin converting factor small subunit
MKVTVKMIGGFVHTSGFSELTLDLAHGSTIDTLLKTLKVEESRPKIVARNGHAVAPGETLEDGDRVVISPIFSGG